MSIVGGGGAWVGPGASSRDADARSAAAAMPPTPVRSSVARVSHGAVLARRPRALPVFVRAVLVDESRIREV